MLKTIQSTTKKYHTPVKIPKSNIKILERGKIDTSNTQTNVNKPVQHEMCYLLDY